MTEKRLNFLTPKESQKKTAVQKRSILVVTTGICFKKREEKMDPKWIKIETNIFDNVKIKLIKRLPTADTIIAIWFELLCLAGKTNNGGIFMISDRIACTPEMLAAIFGRPDGEVKMALETFEKLSMIEVINMADEKVISIKNWGKYQSMDVLEAKRERDKLYQQKRRQEKLLEKKTEAAEKGIEGSGKDEKRKDEETEKVSKRSNESKINVNSRNKTGKNRDEKPKKRENQSETYQKKQEKSEENEDDFSGKSAETDFKNVHQCENSVNKRVKIEKKNKEKNFENVYQCEQIVNKSDDEGHPESGSSEEKGRVTEQKMMTGEVMPSFMPWPSPETYAFKNTNALPRENMAARTYEDQAREWGTAEKADKEKAFEDIGIVANGSTKEGNTNTGAKKFSLEEITPESQNRLKKSGLVSYTPNLSDDASQIRRLMSGDCQATDRRLSDDSSSYVRRLSDDASPDVASLEREREGEKEITGEMTYVISSSNSKFDVEEVTDRWNRIAVFTGLPSVRLITDKRRRSIGARIAEHGLSAVLEAIDMIPQCGFLWKADNRTGWQMTFDWFLRPNNFVKVLEGTYLDKNHPVGKDTSFVDMVKGW